jgi:hypothetical protein
VPERLCVPRIWFSKEEGGEKFTSCLFQHHQQRY